jgi:hypothetical protein
MDYKNYISLTTLLARTLPYYSNENMNREAFEFIKNRF